MRLPRGKNSMAWSETHLPKSWLVMKMGPEVIRIREPNCAPTGDCDTISTV
jgi:hypothetical protein